MDFAPPAFVTRPFDGRAGAAPAPAPAVHHAVPVASGDEPPPRRWRIAVVTETWPPEVNGVAMTIERAVRGIAERGHAVQLVRPRQLADDATAAVSGRDRMPPHAGTRAIEHLLRPGMAIPRYPQLRLGLPSQRALLDAWRAQPPDVVHIVTEGPLGHSALQAARRLGVPTVSEFRTNFHAYSGHYGFSWLRRPLMAYLRHFHNATATTMVPTGTLRSELAAAGFERLRVVARGVDTRRFSPAWRSPALRASWGAGPQQLVALYVGRLAPEKNLGTLVQAAETLAAEDPGLRLVIVGDGPERERLRRALPRAVFAGECRGAELAAHYASADVFLFPSVTETWGNVVPEAMASGLGLLAFDHAAAAELVRHGEDGLLAPVGDAATYCALARRLAGDVTQARRLGQRARQRVATLDWARIVEQVEQAYADAIGMGVVGR